MPPRRAAPAKSPVEPSPLSIGSPILKKRVLPDFIAKKTVKFAEGTKEGVEPIKEEFEPVDAEMTDEEKKANEQLALRYTQAREVGIWLQEEIHQRKVQTRLENGDLFLQSPPNSDEEVDEEFDFCRCELGCGNSADDVLYFVWEHALGVQEKFETYENFKYMLNSEPVQLLGFLDCALEQAACKIGPEFP